MTPASTPKEAVHERFVWFLVKLGLGTGAALLVAHVIATRIARSLAQGRDQVVVRIKNVLDQAGLDMRNEENLCNLRFEIEEARSLLASTGTRLTSILGAKGGFFPYVTQNYPECGATLNARLNRREKRKKERMALMSAEDQKLEEQRKADFKLLQTRIACTRRFADTVCEVNPDRNVLQEQSVQAAITRAAQIDSWESRDKLYGMHNSMTLRRCDPRRPRRNGLTDCGPSNSRS